MSSQVLDGIEDAIILHLALKDALETIPERQRLVLGWRVLGDMTYTEIARTLGVSSGRVEQLLNQARRRLLDALGDYDEQHEKLRSLVRVPETIRRRRSIPKMDLQVSSWWREHDFSESLGVILVPTNVPPTWPSVSLWRKQKWVLRHISYGSLLRWQVQ